MIQKIFLVLNLLFITNLNAQSDGYWDKDRTTNKELVVSAFNKMIVKSEDFPEGTTEILYRITLLDENQQLSSSLVSLLKAIPDPTGISQGSAGAIFLFSKVAGSDKCKYAIFTSDVLAKDYQENGNISKACLVQSEPISKDAKLITIYKSTCLNEKIQNLWFGFENKNWIMNQKIILEIVPWIDNKLSRGWNETNKKNAIEIFKKLNLEINLINKDLFALSILDKVQKEYTFADFIKLSALEKSKIGNEFGNQVLKETTNNSKLVQDVRNDANQYYKNKKYDEAIQLIEQALIDKNIAKSIDYNQIGYYYLFTKQYQKALQNLEKGEKLDNSNLSIKLNLAHTKLLLDDFSDAKNIYKKYQTQNINTTTSWKKQVEIDFENFKKAGITSENFERILNKLNKNY